MSMRTDTYDTELWQLVPKDPTDHMINSTHAKYGFPGGSVKTYPRGYKAYLAAAPTPPASAQSVEPYAYVYEFYTPLGVHKSFSSDRRNGAEPSRTLKVYTAPPSAADVRDSALEEAAQEIERTPGRLLSADAIRALKSKQEA